MPKVDAAQLKQLRDQKRKIDEALRIAGRLGAKDDAAYQRHKAKMAERSREQTRASRDIGELPAVANPERRERCRLDLKAYGQTYHAETCNLPLAEAHGRVIEKLQRSILEGGLFAVAMPRGSGKTAWCEIAAEWAVVYGHRRFVAFIGAEAQSAQDSLESIRMDFETNETLAEDFPEICYPIARLERVNQRRLTYRDKAIRIGLTATELILPDCEGSPSAGAIIRCAGITGRIRGMKAKDTRGRTVRPDFVVVDDPQTDESAHSVQQCEDREAILCGAILGLAGPTTAIAAVMPCTVICPGDMADRILNEETHAEWQPERCSMLDSMPTDLEWWQGPYLDALNESLRRRLGHKLANELYAANIERANAGAKHYWPDRIIDGDVSAIQGAMNVYLKRPEAFAAEYQNKPLAVDSETADDLKPEEITVRINRLPRGRLPLSAQHVTGMIDVQDRALYFAVCGWSSDFTGWVLDYGAFPEQGRKYFAYSDLRITLGEYVRGGSVEADIYAGLTQLVERLCETKYRREDGAELRLERLLVDANWRSDTIYDFARSTKYPTIVTPSHGKFVGASSQPLNDRKPKQGDRVGNNWLQPNVSGRRASRYVLFDANYWKSFLVSRLRTGLGGTGALSLFGDSPAEHRMLADHITAERCDRVSSEKTGRTVETWTMKPGRADNHLFDTLVGACVGASMQGCALPGQLGAAQLTRKKIKIPEHLRR